MSLVGRNIAANLVGGVLLAAMILVLTPLQVGLLGMEAYGIIGFVATLQVAFTIFDFGLSSTLTKEIAADHSADRKESDALIQTAATIYWIVALVIGSGLALLAGPVARGWLSSETLSTGEIEASIRVIALYLALRWPVALYVGILGGFQRMGLLNVLKVTASALRLGGGIVVLLLWRSLEAFLWWTAASALIEVAAYDLACRRIHPSFPRRPGITRRAIHRVWRFSASMSVLAIIGVVIVQLDRLMISTMRPLGDLGTYNLAYTAASALTLLVVAVSSAVLPSLASAHGKADRDALLRGYDQADRVLLFLVTPVALALIFYGEPILALWVGASHAAGTGLALALLAAGFWVSAAIINVYNSAVACGTPGLHLRVNLVSALPYALLLYVLIENFGIEGAAAAWLILNLGYAVALVPTIHRRVLGKSTGAWALRTLLPFFGLGIACFSLPFLAFRLYPAAESGLASLIPLAVSLVLWAAASYWLGFWLQGAAFLRSMLAGIRARGGAEG